MKVRISTRSHAWPMASKQFSAPHGTAHGQWRWDSSHFHTKLRLGILGKLEWRNRPIRLPVSADIPAFMIIPTGYTGRFRLSRKRHESVKSIVNFRESTNFSKFYQILADFFAKIVAEFGKYLLNCSKFAKIWPWCCWSVVWRCWDPILANFSKFFDKFCWNLLKFW